MRGSARTLTYSYSRIGTYDDCPRLYQFGCIEKPDIEFAETIETFLGSLMHEALEKLYRDKRYERTQSVEELLAHFNKVWSGHWNARILIVRKEYAAEDRDHRSGHGLSTSSLRPLRVVPIPVLVSGQKHGAKTQADRRSQRLGPLGRGC